MFAHINDLTAYLIIKEVADAIKTYNDAERRAETDRDQSYNAKDIVTSILSAIPDVAKLIKEIRAAQQPAIQPGKAVSIQKLPGCLVKKIIWDFLGDNLTPEQLGILGTWLEGNHEKPAAPDATVQSDSPSFNDGNHDPEPAKEENPN